MNILDKLTACRFAALMSAINRHVPMDSRTMACVNYALENPDRRAELLLSDDTEVRILFYRNVIPLEGQEQRWKAAIEVAQRELSIEGKNASEDALAKANSILDSYKRAYC